MELVRGVIIDGEILTGAGNSLSLQSISRVIMGYIMMRWKCRLLLK
jgi:hypothetical protein